MATIVTASEAAGLVFEKDALLIDIREPEEYRRMRIIGARLMPLSVFLHLPVSEEDSKRAVIFFCQTGRRAQMHMAELGNKGYLESYVLEGGLLAWKEGRFPVVEERGPLPLMRQVQIGAGSLVLSFALLSLIWPVLGWGVLAVGAGLVFSGATGFCGLARLLMQMPWNRRL